MCSAGMRSMVLAALCLVAASVSGAARQAPDIALFFQAADPDQRTSERALQQLSTQWKNAYTPLIVDAARFLPRMRPVEDDLVALGDVATAAEARRGGMPSPAARTRQRLIRFLERHTGQRFGDDLGRWREWMWALPYEPHPAYGDFKRQLYGRVDPRMRNFFPPGVKASIRLDEIDWGGVPVNGIPPLISPRVIPAGDAGYLKDDHIVFGMVVNGEARAYPRRILAWHEMARDRVGGVDLAVVYCTLCGTVIPYESLIAGRRFTFGTSGLLYRSNKLMFDEETATLWSTLEGAPAVGPLVGSGLRLKARPIVTTTWGEWRRAQPGTTVLSLDTGHDRDYSDGAAYREYFATDRLMFRVPKTDRRLANKDEVLGLLVPAKGGGRQAAAFDVRLLRRQRLFEAEIEGRRFVVVTSPDGANRVYETGDVRLAQEADGTLRDAAGRRWRLTEESLTLENGSQRLPRITAFRAFWFGWYAQFPETLLFR